MALGLFLIIKRDLERTMEKKERGKEEGKDQEVGGDDLIFMTSRVRQLVLILENEQNAHI